MARQSALQVAKSEIVRWFTESTVRVFTHTDIRTLLSNKRDEWHLPAGLTMSRFVGFLLENTSLREIRFTADLGGEVARYSWGKTSPFEWALTLRKNAYLSHGTAVFLHALTDELSKTIYVNAEQSPKPLPFGPLIQENLDLAFSRPPRKSRNLLRTEELSFLVINGKFTGRLEVGTLPGPNGEMLQATKLERTLIDIAVRPAYAGGVHKVLDAYRAAREKVSVNHLAATLRKLAYVYPYHQAIGFLMQRAAYEDGRLDPLRRPEMNVDFYLMHGMRAKDYDRTWRLFFPKGL